MKQKEAEICPYLKKKKKAREDLNKLNGGISNNIYDLNFT